jgi:hypothetical protein
VTNDVPTSVVVLLYLAGAVAAVVALLTVSAVQRWTPISIAWVGFGGRSWATARALSANYIADRELRIADLVTAENWRVDRKTFERCTFRGPALVVFTGGITENVVFDTHGNTQDTVI